MNKIGMFRGKMIDKNEWVYGFFIKSTDDRCFIGKNLHVNEKGNPSTLKQTFDAIEVIPESIGQYITAEDKNGKPIYGSIEIDGKSTKGGDIVECIGYQKKFRAEIIWWEMNCCFELWSCTNGGDELHNFINDNADHEELGLWTLEVIGNKLDNPELLKVKKHGGCDVGG